ncbi:MAG: cytochrome c biogenesis protein CcdA [Intestinimonas sp.]
MIVDEEGRVRYSRKKLRINTLFFVIGVSFASFPAGFGFTGGSVLLATETPFARIGGTIVVLFGLFQLGVFKACAGAEHRFPFPVESAGDEPAPGISARFYQLRMDSPKFAKKRSLMASSATSPGLIFADRRLYATSSFRFGWTVSPDRCSISLRSIRMW